MKILTTSLTALTLGILLVISFRIDWRHVADGGAIDLRNRVTGARLLQDGRDAYHYKWNIDEPDTLCDPYNNPALAINKVTVTPTLLAIQYPWAAISYRITRYLWMITQWLLLAGIGLAWWRAMPTAIARASWAAALLAFTFTVAWRHHVDRGQAYVLIAFLVALWARLAINPSWSRQSAAGFVAGLWTGIRPPVAILLGSILGWQHRRQCLGLLVGLALAIAAPMAWRADCWSDYRMAMGEWSQHYLAGTGNPRPPRQAFPPDVEDLKLNVLAHFDRRIPFADSSIFAGWRAIRIPAALQKPLSAGVLAVVLGLWVWRARRHGPEEWMAGFLAWTFLLDFFLPAYRNSYTDVMILNLAAVLIIRGDWRDPWKRAVLILLAAAWPAGWAVLHELPRESILINMPTLLAAAAAALECLRLICRPLPASQPSGAA